MTFPSVFDQFFAGAYQSFLYVHSVHPPLSPLYKGGDWPSQKLQEGVGSKILGKKGVVSNKGGSFWEGESIPKSEISEIVNVWNSKSKFLSAFFKNEYSQLNFYYTNIYHAFYFCFCKSRKTFK